MRGLQTVCGSVPGTNFSYAKTLRYPNVVSDSVCLSEIRKGLAEKGHALDALLKKHPNLSEDFRTLAKEDLYYSSLGRLITQSYDSHAQGNDHLLPGILDMIDSLMKEMELTYVPKAETNNLVLAWDREQSNAHIYTDRDRLIQILEHLLDNAIKFTTKGTVRWGYQEKENGQIRFYVTDTGCGIPNDKKEVIFERFVKLDSFTQGLGLGLSLCKIIIERMHGTIGVESEVGEGSTFWFTIPNLSDNHI